MLWSWIWGWYRSTGLRGCGELNTGGKQTSWRIWGRVISGAQGCCSPQRSSQPLQRMGCPKRLYNAITRDRGHAHPQSASWQGLTPLWSTGAPTLCLLEFTECRYLQELEKQTNPQQALQPFLPLFLPLLPSSLALLPSPDGHSCFRHGGRSLSGCFHGLGQRASAHWEGTSTALTLLCCSGKGSKAPRDMVGNWDQHRDVNPSTGMPGPLS